MDRSFLSHAEVVAAARDFICIRPTTYEDEAEARFMQRLFLGHSGAIENTTFAFLSPTGEPISRASRGAQQLFGNAGDMARQMRTLAARYPRRETGTTPSLPVTLDDRLGLNVAAADGRPLVLVVAPDAASRLRLEARVAPIAWSPEWVGRFVYATSADATKLFPGVKLTSGVLVIEPDQLGLGGKVVQAVADAEVETLLPRALQAALGQHQTPVKDRRQHVALGVARGAFWEPKLPVTDPMEAAARQRTQRAMQKKP